MAAPMTLRLDKKTRQRIARIAERKNVSASDVVRQAIASWVEQQEAMARPYELIADLVGIAHGGDPKRSSNMGRRLTELLKKRRRSR